MERDPLAPTFYNGETKILDCSDIVIRRSFQPNVAIRENGGEQMMMDGSITRDVLAYKLRDTWTLNNINAATLAQLHALAEMDCVTAEVFDHRINETRKGVFIVELTDPAKGAVLPGQGIWYPAGGTLTLEEV